jgi:hypothetical protein
MTGTAKVARRPVPLVRAEKATRRLVDAAVQPVASKVVEVAPVAKAAAVVTPPAAALATTAARAASVATAATARCRTPASYAGFLQSTWY